MAISLQRLSCPALRRASTSFWQLEKKDVDGRVLGRKLRPYPAMTIFTESAEIAGLRKVCPIERKPDSQKPSFFQRSARWHRIC